ncbi:hypothetical protein [uncultured Aquimarina sp.]|uniref:hypothetical protein n=1 Tax=uncultured Aquimarina sp. TaxID=575652 RepID=UPI002631CDB3|nr:hypothetical protein [uncultured Aquimarina sp.]
MIIDLILLLTICLPFYFIYNRVFQRLTTKKRLVIALLTFTSSIILLCFVVFPSDYYQWNSFKKEKWNTHAGKRFKMSKDLMKNHIKIGMHKFEIVDLLGDGTDTFKFRDSTNLYYYLGQTPGIFKLDPDFLAIQFKDSLVVDFNQFED